jgi:uncharacterized repeat protein (TIGR01451 family)
VRLGNRNNAPSRLPSLIGITMMAFAIGGGAALQAQSVQTVQSGPVQLVLRALKVTREANGNEGLVPVSRVRPGEVVEYQVRYSNTSNRAVRNLQATLPIPAALEFVSGSASPAAPLASTDGKSYEAMPLKRKVVIADGTEKIVLVPTSEYRYLRWSVSQLGAGEKVTVSARARLNK